MSSANDAGGEPRPRWGTLPVAVIGLCATVAVCGLFFVLAISLPPSAEVERAETTEVSVDVAVICRAMSLQRGGGRWVSGVVPEAWEPGSSHTVRLDYSGGPMRVTLPDGAEVAMARVDPGENLCSTARRTRSGTP